MAEVTQDTIKARYMQARPAPNGNGMPTFIQQFRNAGWDAFQQATLPHTKMEEWRHTNIADIIQTPWNVAQPLEKRLAADSIAPFLYGDRVLAEAVFVDGFFAPELSRLDNLPKGVCLCSLRESLEKGGCEQDKVHLHREPLTYNAFTALNAAMFQDGACLYINRNTVLDRPFHLLFLSTGQQPASAQHIRNLVTLEPCSEMELLTTYASLDGSESYLNNVVEEFNLGEDSTLRRVKCVEESGKGHHLYTAEVTQGANATDSAFVATLSGAIVRNQQWTMLRGAGAESHASGLYCTNEKQLVDNFVHIRHESPHCASRIHYKGILEDQSQAVFTGKVHVVPEAQHTDSNQLNNNLLLSEKAVVHTKPQLEIYADDVKCTHGATAGQPPEEIFFYFRSRGISEEQARAMLTRGFAEEVIHDAPLDLVKEPLHSAIVERYQH